MYKSIKFSFRHLKQGIQEFHGKYVLIPADNAANNIVVVFWLHYIIVSLKLHENRYKQNISTNP